jgi:glycerophosphoryl diester phosphodiesterase
VTLVIGHKGAPRLAPENRIASFVRAREAGVDGVELDVRRAHGGRLAVWHDPVLADGRRLLDTPWDEMATSVDPLDAVLDACAGLGFVNVEIKSWPADDDFDPSFGIVDDVVALLASRTPDEQASVVVSCFHPETLAAARRRLDEQAPDVATGPLIWVADDVVQVSDDVRAAGHRAIHPHHLAVTPELVAAAHATGLAVNCWTCNDPDRMRWLAGLGVDGIITDEVERALQALRQDQVEDVGAVLEAE